MNDDYRSALATVLRRLETSDRYEAEVRRLLSSYDAEVVDRVVSFLREKGMLNDARVTSGVLDRNQGRRAVGANRLRANLERRGAPEDQIALAIEKSSDAEGSRADELLVAKFAERKPEDRARAGRFLFGRGFEEEVIESALDRFFDA